MKVKNINGISANTCKCGSWLSHWIKFSNAKQAGLCKELTCTQFATEGALIQKVNSEDSGWYVVPLCSAHSKMQGHEIELLGKPDLVPANDLKACGK